MQGNPLVNILPVIILAVFLYFVMIRPQSKRQKKVNDMLANMKIGDEVMTAGGFYGIINALDDENVVLELLPDFHKAMIRKQSIVKVITPQEEDEAPAEAEEDAKATPEISEASESQDQTAAEQPEAADSTSESKNA
ncbi:preprotein translocase subunit YajC [Pseudoramibacter faecis]|uniref:preprotein translocase subunit YajC n=1 Tax=Pseudoramibacter faecis TaxID=3108534 RepID=UPI002E75B66A|nr:preprotein translocase subunit YajC [Pseudoramibacter sp. HA2172]